MSRGLRKPPSDAFGIGGLRRTRIGPLIQLQDALVVVYGLALAEMLSGGCVASDPISRGTLIFKSAKSGGNAVILGGLTAFHPWDRPDIHGHLSRRGGSVGVGIGAGVRRVVAWLRSSTRR